MVFSVVLTSGGSSIYLFYRKTGTEVIGIWDRMVLFNLYFIHKSKQNENKLEINVEKWLIRIQSAVVSRLVKAFKTKIS